MGQTINDVIKQKINDIKSGNNVYKTGRVNVVREYVVEASGLEGISFFEKVLIGDSSEGYVDAIKKDVVLIAITKNAKNIHVGDKVVATGKEFTAFYSYSAIGSVVDIFGNDKISGKKLDNLIEIPIEVEPISIMDRISVTRPIYTGITGIDLLYPIGRGQRQLILGDKKTGKTQICLDAIANQEENDVTCIYCAIGKTKKDVKDVYQQLLVNGAMSHTVIIAATNDDPAPVLQNAPYVALSIAYQYLTRGKDILVVLDDLKRHADVIREIALLMNKTPGRDAYPPDIFYRHSRMLELGCQHKNGGSITILPICETKGGDISDFISTNIISITDGQIVLSAKSFEQGQKPAINYGLSVSRLGGAVQNSDMKKIGPVIRRSLLTYLEQKEVFELANLEEMNATIKQRMITGASIMAELKQNKFTPRTPNYMTHSFDDILAKENNS